MKEKTKKPFGFLQGRDTKFAKIFTFHIYYVHVHGVEISFKCACFHLLSDWGKFCCVQWSVEAEFWTEGQVQHCGGRADGPDYTGVHGCPQTVHQGHEGLHHSLRSSVLTVTRRSGPHSVGPRGQTHQHRVRRWRRRRLALLALNFIKT